MRLAIAILAVMILLVLCLALAFSEIDRRSNVEQLEVHKARVEARERLEDDFEHALVKQLAPGDSLDENPYYRILVDRIVTAADGDDFARLSEFVAKNVEDAPTSLERCEFHEFEFLASSGAAENVYIVIVCDGRCVMVFNALVRLRPV